MPLRTCSTPPRTNNKPGSASALLLPCLLCLVAVLVRPSAVAALAVPPPPAGNCSSGSTSSGGSGSVSVKSDSVPARRQQRASDPATTDETDNDSANDLDIDPTHLLQTLTSGRPYHHPNFLTESQVVSLLSEVDQLRSDGKFAPSGLSATQKKDQNFGQADRQVCAVPWWKDSLLRGTGLGSGGSGGSAGGNDDASEQQQQRERESASRKLQSLRHFLSQTLHRPTMSDPTLDHECYYSRSTPGASLSRHMDERHEETKGSRGWLLPSRRSISWLVYLSDPDWDLDRNGGALRTYPQGTVRTLPGSVEVGCHGGNLQVGWLVPPHDSGSRTAGGGGGGGGGESVPVYLDSWYKVADDPAATGGQVVDEPHCVLYVVSVPDGTVTYITRPWLNDALQGLSASDFVGERARVDEVSLSPNTTSEGGPRAQAPPPMTTLFVTYEYARDFRLLEDRKLWDEGGTPDGSVVVDVIPERGSLVMFDSVTVPHEVRLVTDGTRAALAGWFHERTQPFPEHFYDSS